MISDDKTVVSSLMSTTICSQFSVYLSNHAESQIIIFYAVQNFLPFSYKNSCYSRFSSHALNKRLTTPKDQLLLKRLRIRSHSRVWPGLRLPFTFSGVFSFSSLTSLIRIGHPQPIYISIQWKAYEIILMMVKSLFKSCVCKRMQAS